jgi:VanZ family protein
VLVADEAASLTGLRLERSANAAVLEGLDRRIDQRRQGRAEGARAHIRNAAEPVSVAQMRFDRAAEVWAAISLSALLVGLAVVILVVPDRAWAALVVIVVAFVIGESVLRGTFLRTANQVAVILALIATAVLLVHYWVTVFVALLVGLAAFLVYQRLREFRP